MFYLDKQELEQRPDGIIDTTLLESYLFRSPHMATKEQELEQVEKECVESLIKAYKKLILAWRPDKGAPLLKKLIDEHNDLFLRLSGGK